MLHMLLAGLFTLTQGPTHDRAFWREIAAHDNALPASAQIEPLVHELSSYLASPDPELRDEFGYSILTAWIFEKKLVAPDLLRGLINEWTTNLRKDIGSTDTDAVFHRSFSALMLSVAVARDNAAPYLESPEVHALLTAATTYLHDERDIRGYDPQHGWMHSAAHTADLLKFLARSRFLAVTEQPFVLDAISAKLRDTPDVFTHGEDERFARAILSIVNRQDFDPTAFTTWLTRTTPARPKPALPEPAVLNARQNTINLFAKLEVLLTLQDAPTPAATTARDALRAVLKKSF